MIKLAIVGYGNIGRYAVGAALAAEDVSLIGIVRRKGGSDVVVDGLKIPVVNNIKMLGDIDVALLCSPTRSIPELAPTYLQMGINTVDSFDIHSAITGLRRKLDPIAKEGNAVSIISAGWDPGSDSVIRTLLEACAPKGITYTNFGPGMSMGHSVAAKNIEGVSKALSMTIPLGTGVHRRMVYVTLSSGADINTVTQLIKSDPYFASDETKVIEVEDVDMLLDKGHGVNMVRKGVSGTTDNQLFEFNMKINNPALTAQVMVSCARASMKQKPGAYTMIEIPVIDYLPGEREDIIARLV